MIRHIWTLVCKQSNVDSLTNNLSIVDVLENFQVALNIEDKNYKKETSIGFPQSFEVVSLFFKDRGSTQSEITEVIRVVDPKGQKLGEFTADVRFEAGKDRMRNIFKFDTIALTVSGTYLFQVFTHNKGEDNKLKQVTAIPLDVALTVNGEKL